MKKKKVLHFINGLGFGGAERYLLNLSKTIDKKKYEFDVIVRSDDNPLIEEFEGKVIESPLFPKNMIKNYRFLKDINKEKYDIIYIHANSLIYIFPFLNFFRIKRQEEPKVILHSHSSLSTNRIVQLIHKFNKSFLLNRVDVKIACSKKAGEWMFGHSDYQLVYNGIDINKFRYDYQKRIKIREELNIQKKEVVIGTVGRLVEAKNYEFLIKMFSELIKNSRENYKLLIVGHGELWKDLNILTNKLGIEGDVIFTGRRSDVNYLLSGMDIYVQPSLYEGYPFTVIEAQVSNLPVIVSDTITEEVQINPNFVSLSTKQIEGWIKTINEITKQRMRRSDDIKVDFESADMYEISREIEKIFENIGTK